MTSPLSFEEIARYVATKPVEDRARVCREMERNIAWDSAKLLARANEIAMKGTTNVSHHPQAGA